MNTVLPDCFAPTSAIRRLRIFPKCTGSWLWQAGQILVVVSAPHRGQAAEASRPSAAKAGGSAPLNPVRSRSTSSISGSQRWPSRLDPAGAAEPDLPLGETARSSTGSTGAGRTRISPDPHLLGGRREEQDGPGVRVGAPGSTKQASQAGPLGSSTVIVTGWPGAIGCGSMRATVSPSAGSSGAYWPVVDTTTSAGRLDGCSAASSTTRCRGRRRPRRGGSGS